jgi:hydrogenase maturation protein HypF
MAERLRILLAGAVQGVGFRPAVYRLAVRLNLCGTVENTPSGLHIEVEGDRAKLLEFESLLQLERPPLARVLFSELHWLPPSGYANFRILESTDGGGVTAAVMPDLAPCPDCLREWKDDSDRRQGYPFINCTNCGPRYSVVLDLPYDRPNTTLKTFALCPDCRAEYETPGDRRFHAQPVACPRCGPRLETDLRQAVAALGAGRIVALKGVGGYQLLADAQNEAAVLKLRERKHREWKPFALLAASVEQARDWAALSSAEAALLESPAAPIVLLRRKPEARIAPSVCGVSPWIGVMLPASPLHFDLMQRWRGPLVATSGNRSDEPIAYRNKEAEERLAGVADLFIHHDRPIARPCDDSVARVVRGTPVVLRRARGFAPLPVPLPRAVPPILAVGGHLKNTIALGVGRQAIVSQHLGDLDTIEAREAFAAAVEDLSRLYRFQPEAVACDLHPDYYTTLWAEQSGLPLVRVQHHEAHAFSCLAENDVRGAAAAVCWDGTGYGWDQTIWGGEIFLVTQGQAERIAHLRPFSLAGGDAAAKDCRRSAMGLFHEIGKEVDEPLASVLRSGAGCVRTTSMGRLFDAVAYLTGAAAKNRFEGEAGLALEAAAWNAPKGEDPYPMGPDGDWQPLLEAVLQDLAVQEPVAQIAARFHLGLARWAANVVRSAGARLAVLSGGCFQNAFLSGALCEELKAIGVDAVFHQAVPPNDGGLSLGQLAAAARIWD